MAERETIHEITKHFGTLSGNDSTISMELNLVSWAENRPVYDLRRWKNKEDGDKIPLRGLVLKIDELKELKKLLQEMEL